MALTDALAAPWHNRLALLEPERPVNLHVGTGRAWTFRIDQQLARRIEMFLRMASREEFSRFRSELFRTFPDDPGMALPAPWPPTQKVLDR